MVRCLFFFFYVWGDQQQLSYWLLLDVFLYYSMDPALCCDWSVSTTFFHPFWSSSLSAGAVRISSDVVRKKREQTGAHGARETAAYMYSVTGWCIVHGRFAQSDLFPAASFFDILWCIHFPPRSYQQRRKSNKMKNGRNESHRLPIILSLFLLFLIGKCIIFNCNIRQMSFFEESRGSYIDPTQFGSGHGELYDVVQRVNLGGITSDEPPNPPRI